MKKVRILIVEDEAIIAMEIESQLQGLGYEVTSIVDTGEKAIQKAEADKPDIMLMDIRIKGEMDGIDTAEVIRNRFGIPVVFSTAYLDEERIERAKITMPFGYVLKPIQERDLKVTIEMALYVSKVDAERRIAEEKLKESQFLFSEMFEQSNTSIQLFDPDGYCLMVNAKFCDSFGVPAEDLVGGKYNIFADQNLMSPRISILVNGVFREKKFNKWEGLFDIGASADLFGISASKRKQVHIETLGYPILDSTGQVKYVVFHTHDITERKQTENDLLKSEEKLHDLVLCSADWIWEVDKEGKFTYVSERIENILGYHPDEVIGKRPYDLMPKEEALRIEQQFKEIAAERKPIVDVENWNLTKEGKAVCLLTNGVPILDDEGNYLGYRGVDKNITAFKNTEKVI